MSNRDQINTIDNQINSLRFELIRIIAQINFTIGTDRRAILSAQYKQLKSDYYEKKKEIHSLRSLKDSLSDSLNSYLRAS
jgi:hypothetical protein